jgi:hypothetical protein
MADNQAVRQEAIAKQHEALFFLRVIRIIDQASVLVQKNSLCFLERDAMLYQIRSSFAAILGKFHIAQIIILAISSRKCGRGRRRAMGYRCIAVAFHAGFELRR